MPRAGKGPRLYLRPPQRGAAGSSPIWTIRDGNRFISTGCGPDAREDAERALARYISEKHDPKRGERGLAQVPIADVLNIYLTDVAPHKAEPRKIAARAIRLLEWWGDKTLADVTGSACRAYVAHRGNAGGARRDLQDLSAAIRHHHKEGLHRASVAVWLPPAGKRRERWLTRSEIARLVWTAWRMREQMRRSHSDKNAARLPTRKRTGKHIARAILFAYYTGSRIGTVLTASWHAAAGRSYIDIDRGVFYRLPEGKRETAKRQPPVRLSSRMLAHVRRWRDRKLCASHVVEWEGKPVRSIKTAFGRIVDAAGLGDDVSPHTLRHSRATHMKQAGVSSWEVAGALGMSEAMVEKVYGHHDPNHLSRAVNAR